MFFRLCHEYNLQNVHLQTNLCIFFRFFEKIFFRLKKNEINYTIFSGGKYEIKRIER